MKILVVEDDDLIVEFLKRSMQAENHDVTITTDGEQGLEKARSDVFDVIVLDIMLPMKSGLEVCRELRDQGISTPIIFLSARNAESARVQGLDVGADDYLVKPFSYKELSARLRALARRPNVAGTSKLTIGPISIDSDRHEVVIDGAHADLRVKEFELLEYMMRHPGIVLSKEQILKDVWGISYESASNRLEVSLNNLRQKIDTSGDTSLIKTIRNKGYKFVA